MTDSETLTGDESAIYSARKIVRHMTEAYGLAARDTAELLTGELVTNAVRHGGGQFTATAVIDDAGCLRVTVSDAGGSAALVVNQPGHLQDGGRGLMLLVALSSHWGTERHGADKSVWFELDLRSEARAEGSQNSGISGELLA